MDYLLPQRGDDPVGLFLNVLKDYFHGVSDRIEKIEKDTIQALLGE
jgi:hypothetical protein